LLKFEKRGTSLKLQFIISTSKLLDNTLPTAVAFPTRIAYPAESDQQKSISPEQEVTPRIEIWLIYVHIQIAEQVFTGQKSPSLRACQEYISVSVRGHTIIPETKAFN
jgi:hypothetical protein